MLEGTALTRAALRICCVNALLGNTFAGSSVLDSKGSIIDTDQAADARQPFIAVYTDDQSGVEFTLTFEIGVNAQMQFTDESGQTVVVDGIPPTDEGFELVIDFIDRQIMNVLNDDQNEWAEIYRNFVQNITGVSSIRGSSKDADGIRFAGRQIVISGTTRMDPEFGAEIVPGGFFDRFLSKMDADENLARIATTFRKLLVIGPDSKDWQLDMRELGLTRAAADSMGIAPKFADEATPMQVFETATDADVVD